eukprot:gene32900-42580_t
MLVFEVTAHLNLNVSSCLFVAVVLINLIPNLTVLFFLVSLCKALVFSLQDPVKELLYIPTSEDIKYKAKAWYDR